jgi:hypothetical protein
MEQSSGSDDDKKPSKTKYKSKWCRNQKKNQEHILQGYMSAPYYSKVEVFELKKDSITADMVTYVEDQFLELPSECYSIYKKEDELVCVACWRHL